MRGGEVQRRVPLEAQSAKRPPDALRVLEEARDVLDKDGGRADLPDDPDEVRPEGPVVAFPLLLPRDAVGLAGETGSDEIHSAAPRAAPEGRKVVPDRSRSQVLVLHARDESGRRAGFPLNVTHSSVSSSERSGGPEFHRSDPGT